MGTHSASVDAVEGRRSLKLWTRAQLVEESNACSILHTPQWEAIVVPVRRSTRPVHETD
jgi:hypothetical protein